MDFLLFYSIRSHGRVQGFILVLPEVVFSPHHLLCFLLTWNCFSVSIALCLGHNCRTSILGNVKFFPTLACMLVFFHLLLLLVHIFPKGIIPSVFVLNSNVQLLKGRIIFCGVRFLFIFECVLVWGVEGSLNWVVFSFLKSIFVLICELAD